MYIVEMRPESYKEGLELPRGEEKGIKEVRWGPYCKIRSDLYVAFISELVTVVILLLMVGRQRTVRGNCVG